MKVDQPGLFAQMGRSGEVRRLAMTRDVLREVIALFETQAADLLSGDTIPFSGGYHAEEDQVLEIGAYSPPDEIVRAIGEPLSVDALSLDDVWSVTSIFAGSGVGPKLQIAWQSFDQRRALGRGRFTLFTDGNTFTRLDGGGIVLDTSIAAVFQNGGLYFRSFVAANRVLPLTDYYREATSADVQDFTNLPQLLFADPKVFRTIVDVPMRRRIAAIVDSNVLREVKPNVIATVSKHYKNLNLSTKAGRLVIPTDKRACKEVLRFLCQDYFRGDLTRTPFVTSSKRPLGKK